MTKFDNMRFEQLKSNVLSCNVTGELGFDSFVSICDVCSYTHPTNILELGFNRGISAIMFLECSNASVHSIDRRTIDSVKSSIDYINKTYKNRFKYTSLDHNQLSNEKYYTDLCDVYDLVFIDGDHSYAAVKRDTENSLRLNPKYLLFDDYTHIAHEKDIKRVIKEFDLEVIETYNTTCGHVLTRNRKHK